MQIKIHNAIPPHAHEEGHCQNPQKIVLVWMYKDVEPLCTLGENVKCVATVKKLLQKIKNRITLWTSTTQLLGIHTKELKAWSQLRICTLMFTVALFTIVKRWEQPKTAKNTHRGKENLFNEWCCKNYILTCREVKLDPDLTSYPKINSN